jgi:hypothetical protein
MAVCYACHLSIGGEVRPSDLPRLLAAIAESGLWLADRGKRQPFSGEHDLMGAIVDAAKKGETLELQDDEARHGDPGRVHEVCRSLGVDYNLGREGCGNGPSSLEIFRGKAGRHEYFDCGGDGRVVVPVEDVLKAIGEQVGDLREIDELRRRLTYPKLTPIKLVD